MNGGPQLLQRTQTAYFKGWAVKLSYSRLFRSIVTEDFDHIVQNSEWQDIIVVLCTFAKGNEFANLAEQLGQRLEFQALLAKDVKSNGFEEKVSIFRRRHELRLCLFECKPIR